MRLSRDIICHLSRDILKRAKFDLIIGFWNGSHVFLLIGDRWNPQKSIQGFVRQSPGNRRFLDCIFECRNQKVRMLFIASGQSWSTWAEKKTEHISFQGGNHRKLLGRDPLNKTSGTPIVDPLNATSGTHAWDPLSARSGTDAQAHELGMILIRVEGSFRWGP